MGHRGEKTAEAVVGTGRSARAEGDLAGTASARDFSWMERAIEEGRAAAAEGEVPVGAVVVYGDTLLGSGRNGREAFHDPTAHAEMAAIRMAAHARRSWRLDGCTLYVTLEPCPMCAGAIVLARIARVVFGAWDPRAGAAGTLYDILHDGRLNHRCEVRGGVLAEGCSSLLHSFFLSRRKRA